VRAGELEGSSGALREVEASGAVRRTDGARGTPRGADEGWAPCPAAAGVCRPRRSSAAVGGSSGPRAPASRGGDGCSVSGSAPRRDGAIRGGRALGGGAPRRSEASSAGSSQGPCL